jgi:hypothetical protein
MVQDKAAGPTRGPAAHDRVMEVVMLLTREDVARVVGAADDVTIAQIIGTGATAEELAEAQAWLANDEPMMNAGRPLAKGRVRELVDILSELDPSDDEDERGASSSPAAEQA